MLVKVLGGLNEGFMSENVSKSFRRSLGIHK